MNKWDETLKPKYFYRSDKRLPLSSVGERSLTDLYRPVIGVQAMALYFALTGDIGEEDLTHLDLLNDLNIGLPQFIKERQRLEGLGLLRTYLKEDSELGDQYLYELIEPLPPEDFFKDQMMSFLLLNQVGEKKFRQLKGRFNGQAVDTDGYREVTSKFTEVYSFSQQDFKANEETLNQTAAEFHQSTEAQQPLDSGETDTLDWELLFQLAGKRHISPSAFTPVIQEKVKLYHRIYGYQPLELVDFLADAYSIEKQAIDEKALERFVLKVNQKTAPKPVTEVLKGDAQTRRKNTLLQQGFTEGDWATIQDAEELTPMEYLQAVKENKGSFVTDGEQWLIRDLVQKSPLPNSVINILINYELIVQNHSAMSKQFANSIAANWSEKGIKTPEAAIKYVRDFTKEAQEKAAAKGRPRQGNYRKPVKESEKLRDWSQYETKKDPDKAQELDRKLKQYFQEGED